MLLNNGCVYQERLGWERPGWFDVGATPSPVRIFLLDSFYLKVFNEIYKAKREKLSIKKFLHIVYSLKKQSTPSVGFCSSFLITHLTGAKIRLLWLL